MKAFPNAYGDLSSVHHYSATINSGSTLIAMLQGDEYVPSMGGGIAEFHAAIKDTGIMLRESGGN